jgi:hypothetical protein
LVACSCVFGQESNPEQEQIVAMIKKMGGEVAIDKSRPGKPVVEIHLYQGKTACVHRQRTTWRAGIYPADSILEEETRRDKSRPTSVIRY